MIKVVLLGTGNVATHLFEAFRDSENIKVIQVYNHSSDSLSAFEGKANTTTSLSSLVDADLYLLALKDDVIADIASKLSGKKALIAHTSGSVALNALQPCSRRGVFYPLQTFSKSRELSQTDIPFCLEAAEKEDLEILKRLAKEISGKAFEVSSEQRKKLHLAAVFVCNFVNHLYAIGEDICNTNDLPFEILQPLIQETAAKVSHASPFLMQTGPAKRNDTSTIEAHLSLIASEENKEIYKLLTKAIQSQHGKEL